MEQLGRFALFTVKNRIAAGIGSRDTKMPSLGKGYAIQKGRKGRGRTRDLDLSGDMLRDFKLTSVSAHQAKLDITTKRSREKAWANELKAEWFAFSPRDLILIGAAGEGILKFNIANMAAGGPRGVGTMWLNSRTTPGTAT